MRCPLEAQILGDQNLDLFSSMLTLGRVDTYLS